MAETRLGVDPSDEPVSGAGVEQPDLNVEQVAQAAPTLTQAEVDAAISRRLAEANAKFSAELDQYRRAMSDRDQAITAMSRELEASRAAKENNADPFAGLDPTERLVAKANAAAVEPLRREFNAQLSQLANLLAPTLANEGVNRFFEEANIPEAARKSDELKSRTSFWLKRGAQQGVTVDGAYRLALSEMAEKQLSGGSFGNASVSQQQAPQHQVVQSRPAPMPQVEIGGGRRNITQSPDDLDYTGIDKGDNIRNLRAWFNKATTLSSQAPEEGAHATATGVRPYNGSKPTL